MQLQLRDFRCFHQPKPVVIRPINILVGENSAGKTSFLAALRYSLEFLSRRAQPSFNKDPFHLGAFDQIAHYRGGRFGRAKSFSFSITHTLPKSSRHRNQLELFGAQLAGGEPATFVLNATFEDFKSQPILKSMEFSAGGYSFRFLVADQLTLHISTPSMSDFKFSDKLSRGRMDFIQDLTSYADFALRDLRYLIAGRIAGSETDLSLPSDQAATQFFAEVEYLSDLYRRVQRVLPPNIYASAPVRSKPERTYNVEDSSVAADGGHIPFVLAELYSFEPDRWQEMEKAMAAFGRASGLFNKVQVKRIGGGASGPFQIVVSLSGNRSNIIDVGYGVSQALPIIADVLRMKNTFFLFQQPEVHLHPKAQAELATFFATAAKARSHTMFVETHSDYLLDRIRMEVRGGTVLRPDDVSILFFEKRDHDVEIHTLLIDKGGNIEGAPPGYRRFFLEEEVRSLGIAAE